MEGRRVICVKGHTVAVLKTDPGKEGDEFAANLIDNYDGTCIYCGSSLGFTRASLSEFEQYKSREDGRYQGSGAPDA